MRVARYISFGVISLLACLSILEAAKLPEWAVAIQATAPELPKDSDSDDEEEDGWHVLLSETHLRIEEDGKLVRRERIAAQALDNKRGDGPGICHFRQDSKLNAATVMIAPKIGKPRKIKGSFIDLTISSSFTTDQVIRLFPIGAHDRGDLAFFEFEVIELPYALTHVERFFCVRETALARLTVEIPPGWSLDHDWLRIEGPAPTVTNNVHRWELRDLSPIEETEEMAPEPWNQIPLLAVSFQAPPDYPPTAPASFRSWKDMGQWYTDWIVDLDTSDSTIASVWGGVDSSQRFDVRVRHAGRYVRDTVRYVGRHVGEGSYRPRPATQVLEEKIGDCKDKGTLFQSVLKAESIASYPILICATQTGTVSERVPTLTAFDHYVVGVSVPEGVALPESYADATIEVEGLGTLLVVDTTDEQIAIGDLHSSLHGKTGLIVAGPQSRLVLLPEDHAANHLIERRLEIGAGAEGKLDVVDVTMLHGDFAAGNRGRWGLSSTDYRERRLRRLRSNWRDPEVASFNVSDEHEDGHFEETLRFETVAAGKRPIALFAGGISALRRTSLRDREDPFVYPHPIMIRYETTISEAAFSGSAPPAHEANGEGWSVRSNFERSDGKLYATCEIKLERTRFEADQVDQLDELWQSARAATAVALSRP